MEPRFFVADAPQNNNKNYTAKFRLPVCNECAHIENIDDGGIKEILEAPRQPLGLLLFINSTVGQVYRI